MARPAHNQDDVTPLFLILDLIRETERAVPTLDGLAEIIWRYSQGKELDGIDRDRLIAMTDALEHRSK